MGRRTRHLGLLFVSAWVVASHPASGAGDGGEGGRPDRPAEKRPASSTSPAPWMQQLGYLQYLVLRTSNINLVKGLNLSTGQARQLRHLARKLDGLVEPQRPGGRLDPRVREVAAVYEELEGTLLRGEEVTDSLRARTLEARRKEARFLREGLRYDASASRCLRCHALPGEEGRGSRWRARHGRNPAVLADMDSSHCNALVGLDGLSFLWAAAEEVDDIVSPAQRTAVDRFSCCLVPPEDLAAPDGIGQIREDDDLIRAIEKTRRVPWALMFLVRREAAARATQFARLVNPGFTEADARVLRRRVVGVLNKAHHLSRVDFELQKHELARELRITTATRSLPPQVQRFKRALFLLVPGSSEVYDRQLRDLEGAMP